MNRWLVVGAGAVGLAWGWHAARGGAAVTVLVRARHADVLRIGVDVHPPGLASALRFDGFGFATSADAAADADVVVLAMPSTGIDDTQLRSLHAHAPAHAVVLSLPPGTRDLERVRSAMPGRTVLGGLIAMSAWWEPLETDASDGPRGGSRRHCAAGACQPSPVARGRRPRRARPCFCRWCSRSRSATGRSGPWPEARFAASPGRPPARWRPPEARERSGDG